MPSAVRDLDKLYGNVLQRLKNSIMLLSDNPRPHKVKKLVVGVSQWRIAVGEYRVLYEVNDEEKVVRVFRVRHRKDVHR